MVRISKIYKKIASLYPSGFWPGFVVGLIYFSYILWWFWSLYPLDTLGIESRFYSFLLILFAFTLSTAGTAFFWGLFSFFISRLNKKANFFLVPLTAAGTFVLAEYARAWEFGFLWLGGGSLLGPHWTLGNPAYLLASWPFVLKISSVWGIYGIDFLLVWIASIVFLLIAGGHTIKSRSIFLNFGLMFLIFFITTGLSVKNTASESSTLKVALIQTKSPTKYSADEMLDDFTKKLELIKKAAKTIGGEVIVFPESSNFSKTISNFLDSASVKSYFNKLSNQELAVIDNNILPDQGNYKSRTLFINSKNGISGFYDKQLLTPGGEYLPYVLRLLLSIFKSGVSVFEDSGLKTGTHSELLSYGGFQIKALACSDVLSPAISSQGQYDLLVSLQNLGIFKGSDAMESQFLSILRFRAAENGKYAVLASNFGRSYVLNTLGDVVASTKSRGYQILTADVVPNKGQTWYNKLGDLPILLLSLAVFGLGLKNYLHAKQN